MRDGLRKGADGVVRCWWPGDDAEYQRYHDAEWGLPVFDDHRLFEKICLEGFQSGLSWLTILRKRDAFREAFAGFDFERVAGFDRRKVESLLKNAGIVRHRGKIESTIQNAKRACELVETRGSLCTVFWSYAPPRRKKALDKAALMTMGKTAESMQLSKDLKKLGWTFVGPTTCYAFMQAMGLVNDHLAGCAVHGAVERAHRQRRARL